MKSDYIVSIGLEIHAELKTQTKIFCSCKNSFGDKPNTNVCPVCLSFPGTLPAVNKQAVILAIRAGLALGSRISPHLLFDRKHYFYPDLPKAYQISQDKLPLCIGGGIKLDSGKFIRFNHIHLEEDAGKLIHDTSTNKTFIDFNRAGVPLVEHVTEVDISSADEAVEFLNKLRQTLVFAEVSDCKMEQAQMRCDVNISVKNKNSNELGTKVELKNLNSFKAVHNAIEYETNRQINELENGKNIVQETRKWDDSKGISTSMRKKEESKDYRYMPEPDFISINISPKDIEEIKNTLPPSPTEKFEKYTNIYGLYVQDAKLLISEKHISDYFENAVKFLNEPKAIANWIITDLFKLLKESAYKTLNDIISEENLCQIIKLLFSGKITRPVAKELLNKAIISKENPIEIAKREKLTQVLSNEKITKLVDKVLSENPELFNQYKVQPDKITNFVVGSVMKLTAGKADATSIKDYLTKKLK